MKGGLVRSRDTKSKVGTSWIKACRKRKERRGKGRRGEDRIGEEKGGKKGSRQERIDRVQES